MLLLHYIQSSYNKAVSANWGCVLPQRIPTTHCHLHNIHSFTALQCSPLPCSTQCISCSVSNLRRKVGWERLIKASFSLKAEADQSSLRGRIALHPRSQLLLFTPLFDLLPFHCLPFSRFDTEKCPRLNYTLKTNETLIAGPCFYKLFSKQVLLCLFPLKGLCLLPCWDS